MACRPNPHTNHVHIKEPNYVDPSELRPGDKIDLETSSRTGPMIFRAHIEPAGFIDTEGHGHWYVGPTTVSGRAVGERRVILVERAPEPIYEVGDLVLDDTGDVYERIPPYQYPNGNLAVWRRVGDAGARYSDSMPNRPLRRLKVVEDD